MSNRLTPPMLLLLFFVLTATVQRTFFPQVSSTDESAAEKTSAAEEMSAAQEVSAEVYYRNCAAAWAAGAAPIHIGEPGYEPRLDGDHDGIACEPWRGVGKPARSGFLPRQTGL